MRDPISCKSDPISCKTRYGGGAPSRRGGSRKLTNLGVSKATLPMRGGGPNKRAIAAACGFSREAFYDSPRLASLLEEYLEQLAAEGAKNMS